MIDNAQTWDHKGGLVVALINGAAAAFGGLDWVGPFALKLAVALSISVVSGAGYHAGRLFVERVTAWWRCRDDR